MESLLVHGGAHGAWCWDGVIAELTDQGEATAAFDLPGAGADATPRGGITLTDCVARVIAEVDNRADPVRLVGHSIAGFTLPGVLAARPDRVAEVVLFAAAVVPVGGRGIDTIPADRRSDYFTAAAASEDNTLLPRFEAAWERFFSDLDETAARAAYARLTPQPFAPYLADVTATFSDWDGPVRYVAFADDRNFLADVTAEFADRAGAGCRVIPGDHSGMLSRPAAVAAAILAG